MSIYLGIFSKKHAFCDEDIGGDIKMIWGSRFWGYQDDPGDQGFGDIKVIQGIKGFISKET
jgi:hypothetical protein